VGFQGESHRKNVLWSDSLGIWMLAEVIEGSRYWNAFGIENPTRQSGVGITCEINFPLTGINRRVAGAVAEDTAGDLHILHRGRIGGGRAGIGAELFWAHFAGDRVVATDGDRETTFAVIGSAGSPKLASGLRFFVKEVDRIKGLEVGSGELAVEEFKGTPSEDSSENASREHTENLRRAGRHPRKAELLTERAPVSAARVSETTLQQVAGILIKNRSTDRSGWYWIGESGRAAHSKKSANKYILACVLDYQMKSSVLWDNAKRFAEQDLGDPETLWEVIVSRPLSHWAKRFSEYKLHRFPAAHERVWKIGKAIIDRYDGDARRIWDDTRADEATQRLIEIGVGDQLSRMAVGGLYDCGWIRGACDLKADVHVKRVLGRVFLGRLATPDEAIELSKRMHPKNPWLLDGPLWKIGSSYCRPNEPKCDSCFLRGLCEYGSRLSGAQSMPKSLDSGD
jgi:endonuclease III